MSGDIGAKRGDYYYVLGRASVDSKFQAYKSRNPLKLPPNDLLKGTDICSHQIGRL